MSMKFKLFAVLFALVFSVGIISHETSHYELDHGDHDHADHVYLKLDHLGPEIVHKRLPGITELSKTFAHVDPVEHPIPVVPTCHYAM